MKTSFVLNGKTVTLDKPADAKLLWALREDLGLTGTKYGCGIAMCGSCTVHVDGNATRSCVMPLSSVSGKDVVTIEGLSKDRAHPHPLQKAWIKEQVPQCGYCQSGQIMQAATLLVNNPNPSREQITTHMNGIICRCGTYTRIIKAVQLAGKEGRS